MTKRLNVPTDTSRLRARVETFDRLQAGDVVSITREQGDFVFLGVAVDEAGSPLWADLHGGTPNREQLRSVTIDRLKIPSERALKRQRAQQKEKVSK